MRVLFKTIHGSRLYGLHHFDSDWDYYTVVDRVEKKKASYSTHKIVGGVDSVVVDFGTWINLCQKGVPQALEAMFSKDAEIDNITEFRNSFRAGVGAEGTYFRTMKAMSEGADDFKHRRHLIRLGLNLNDIMRYGRFNPRLGSKDKLLINSLATMSMDKAYLWASSLANAYRM